MRYLGLLTVEWSAIVLAVVLAGVSPWFWPLSIVIIGTRQHAIAVLGHDGAHFAICRNRRLNDVLAALSFWPFGMGLKPYREFHFLHHKAVGTPEDPELALKSLSPGKWRGHRIRTLLSDLCGGGSPEFVRAMFAADFQWASLFVFGVYAVLIALGQWQAVALWVIASGTVFWASFRQRMLEEHCGRYVTSRHRRTPALWRRLSYLPHHIWKHWEHHRWPSIHPRLLRNRGRVRKPRSHHAQPSL